MTARKLAPISLTLALALFACSGPTNSVPTATPQPASVTPLQSLPDTWTPQPTQPATRTPTPSATSPPASPTVTRTLIASKDGTPLPAMTPVQVTAVPRGNIPANWQRVEAETASFSLPPYLEVLDMGSGLGELMRLLMAGFIEGFSDMAEEMGEEFGATPQATLDLSELDDLPAFDLVMARDEDQQVVMMMTGEEMESAVSLEESLNEALSNVDAAFELLRKEMVTEAPLPTARVFLTVEEKVQGKGKQVLYVLHQDNMRWTFYFATPLESFDDHLPAFEQVINSLDTQE